MCLSEKRKINVFLCIILPNFALSFVTYVFMVIKEVEKRNDTSSTYRYE